MARNDANNLVLVEAKILRKPFNHILPKRGKMLLAVGEVKDSGLILDGDRPPNTFAVSEKVVTDQLVFLSGAGIL